jgi:hypothetical protein
MAIDLKSIKNRLNTLKNSTSKTAEFWKPKPGKYIIRVVPYTHNKDNPFIELFFHYNINNKTYLSPISFGRPDPIVEFSDKLKRMGGDDWKAGKKLEPKLRTFVPVLVRGEESDGIRFWGFGKTVYQELLGYIADPDYGDITDPMTGRDLAIEITSPEENGTSYQMTSVRIKPRETPLSEDSKKLEEYLTTQTNIADLYEELSYKELSDIFSNWLNGGKGSDSGDDVPTPSETNSDDDELDEVLESNAKKFRKTEDDASVTQTKSKTADVAAAFDDLFND